MRRLLVTLAAVSACVFSAPARAGNPPVVFVDNQSSVVSQAQVDAAIPAFQTMVSRDLASVWGVDATLTTDPAAHADMRIRLEDDADCFGCLGYHDVLDGTPYARVFARTSQEFNDDVWLVFTHELEEMLADPFINRLSMWNNRYWLVEVSDPCESGAFAYWIDGVPISDFITPRWYDSSLRGPYDFTRHFRRPGQIGRHGYASYRDPNSYGGWSQVFGYGAPWADR